MGLPYYRAREQAKDSWMGKRTVLVRFVGVPDETLKQIGMVIVMAARLDHQRMQMLEAIAEVPVNDVSKLRRDDLRSSSGAACNVSH